MAFMRIISASAAILAAAAVLTACGGGGNNNTNGSNNAGKGGGSKGSQQVKQFNPLHVAHNEIAGGSLQINMGQQNNSKQTGNASVVDQKHGGVMVTIHLKSEPKGASEPAHIHKGTCTKLDPAPWKPLKNVVNGTSQTLVPGVTVAQLKKGKYAINVHKSASDLQTYVSCGDLTL
jgi:hypothetical protein